MQRLVDCISYNTVIVNHNAKFIVSDMVMQIAAAINTLNVIVNVICFVHFYPEFSKFVMLFALLL